jgi:hypothetical protein
MKTHRLLIAFVIVATAFFAYATTKPRHATVSELSTTWVAWTGGEYFRIELKEDGTGLCGFYDLSQVSPKLHEITKWTLKGYDIEMALKPIDADAWQMTMKGIATPTRLNLKLGDGRKNGWRSEATFEHEKEMESMIENTKKRMQDYRKQEGAK